MQRVVAGTRQRLAMQARLGLGLLMGLSVLAMAASGAAAADTTPARASGSLPRTDGVTVVYQAPSDEVGLDVFSMRAGVWTPQPLATGPDEQFSPDIDNGVALWSALDACGHFKIRGKNLAAGSEFAVSVGETNDFFPAISGNWVVWMSAYTTAHESVVQTLQARDITSMAEPTTLDEVTLGPGGGGFLRPAISRDRIAWVRLEQTTTHNATWELKTQQIGDAQATVVDQGSIAIAGPSAPTSSIAMPGYDLANDLLVYSANLNLWLVDFTNGLRLPIASTQNGAWKPAQNPTTDGRYIYWQDYRYAANLQELYEGMRVGPLRSDIVGFDTITGAEFPVTTNTGYNSNPHTRDGVLTYQRRGDWRDEGAEVHAASLSQVLPTAPMPDPGRSDPSWIYFSLTRHYVAYGFKTFWEQSGGIPVFGYSLTEEFSEFDRTVQYFERQRFEYHPEHQGTPYETELGRLGYERAAALMLLGNKPFQPAPADLYGQNADCVYVAATAHHLCGAFKAYWQSHGLEFGDAGFSYRESLALFGHPLSEAYVDPASGLLMQYFERARFEWHPNNPEPHRVLLGRLGYDLLSDRGW